MAKKKGVQNKKLLAKSDSRKKSCKENNIATDTTKSKISKVIKKRKKTKIDVVLGENKSHLSNKTVLFRAQKPTKLPKKQSLKSE